MAKTTQYKRILTALRKAGKRGLTTAELAIAAGSNCVWRRCSEMPIWHVIGQTRYYIDRSWRNVNGRRVRLYRLVKV